jgi:pyruvate-ferredoxin/flavodoxin oxidoreductase
MTNSIRTEKAAVECGYFTTFRYDPRNEAKGLPALTLDCKEPDFTKFRDFVMNETRFSQLPNINPEHAELFLLNRRKMPRNAGRRLKSSVSRTLS